MPLCYFSSILHRPHPIWDRQQRLDKKIKQIRLIKKFQIRKQWFILLKMASNDNFSLMAIGFLIFYGFILITSLVGNIWVLVTCYRNLNRNRFSPMWYVANLASADLLFTFLTPFHAIDFSWRWVGGDTICKLHGFLVDTSYNTSITTLVVID